MKIGKTTLCVLPIFFMSVVRQNTQSVEDYLTKTWGNKK